LSADPDQTLLRQAEVYDAANRPEDVIQVVGPYIARHPDDPAGLMLAATAFAELRRPGALRLARRAVRFAPDSSHAWLILSYVLATRGKPNAAVAAARRAVELDPYSWSPKAYLAERLLPVAADAAWDAVIPESSEHLQAPRGMPHPWRYLRLENFMAGPEYRRKARLLRLEALTLAADACRIAPDDPGPHLTMAKVQHALLDARKAIAECGVVLRLDPDNADARKLLATIDAERMRTGRAIGHLVGLVRTDPADHGSRRTAEGLIEAAAVSSSFVGMFTGGFICALSDRRASATAPFAWQDYETATVVLTVVAFAAALRLAFVLRPGSVRDCLRADRVLLVWVVLAGAGLVWSTAGGVLSFVTPIWGVWTALAAVVLSVVGGLVFGMQVYDRPRGR